MLKSIFILSYLILISSPVCNFEDTLDLVWIEVASGERQCVPPTYTSLDDAIDQLKKNRIPVYDHNEIIFGVCEACSCPTGIIYQAQIDGSDIEKAGAFGWARPNIP